MINCELVTVHPDIEIKLDSVMQILQCEKGSLQYEDFANEYSKWIAAVQKMVKPAAYYRHVKDNEITAMQGPGEIYCIITIGGRLSELSTDLFQKSRYVEGMLVNAMADAFLYELDYAAQKIIISVCTKNNIGIYKRMDMTDGFGEVTPEEIYKQVFDSLDIIAEGEAGENNRVLLNKSAMFVPDKTLGIVFKLTHDTGCMNTIHNCDKCTAVQCWMRQRQGG